MRTLTKTVRVRIYGMGGPDRDLFKVVGLLNVFDPPVGRYLDRTQVEALIAQGINVEVVDAG